jgi:hypothetical protein
MMALAAVCYDVLGCWQWHGMVSQGIVLNSGMKKM